MDNDIRHPAVVLVAIEGDWAGRSLESVLVANAYAVLRAADGHDALVLARRFRPDALIVDANLAGIGGIDLCHAIRDDPGFDPATPVIISAASPSQRTVRQAAYDAGAWDFCTHPIDSEQLVRKLATFLRAKRATAEARQKALLDADTGVLSPLGMERWAEQLAARARRNREPLACVVMMPSETRGGPASVAEADQVTSAITAFLQFSKDSFRRSDVVGRTHDGRLALLAPDTDSSGVEGMLARLRTAISAATSGLHAGFPSPIEFKAGYWAVRDFATDGFKPTELLDRAARALDHISNPSPTERLAMSFDQIPVS